MKISWLLFALAGFILPARAESVVVGNVDVYYPADHARRQNEIPEDFDWAHAPNRRDKLLAALFEGGKREFTVQEVTVGAAGSVHLGLSDNLSLDILPNDSFDDEHWRLLRPGKDETHFVVTGRGIEA